MGPDHAFAQVDAIHDAAFEAEGIEIDPPRAGAEDQRIDAALDLFSKIDPRLATQHRDGFWSQAFIFGNGFERFQVQGFTDAATFTYIDTIFLIHGLTSYFLARV
jgi:hypothetical protein